MVGDPPEAVAEGSEHSDDVFEAVTEGPEHSDDVSEAVAEGSEHSDDASETLGERSKHSDDGSAKPAQVLKNADDAPKRSEHVSDGKGHASRASADAAASARVPQKPSRDAFGQVYQSLFPALLALCPSEVVKTNLGVPGVLTKALGVQPVLAELKALHRRSAAGGRWG